MKMTDKLSKILKLFPVIFLLFINPIFTQISADDIYVDIDDDVFKLLHANSKSKREIAREIIRENMRQSFINAFQRFDKKKDDIKNEAGKDLKCIVNAIDSYRNSLIDFSIHFTFSKYYKRYLKNRSMSFQSFPGDRDGEGVPIFKEGEKQGITIKNVFMRNNYYKKFVTNYKECQFNAFLQCILDENRSLLKIKKDSYTGRKIKNFYSPDKIKYKWKKQGLIKGTLQCIIFHEFVHRALLYSNDKVAESRCQDEATIEDFVSKIFDNEDEFIGGYLLHYSYEEWGKITRQLPDIDIFRYPYGDGKSRKFNPPILEEDETFRYSDGSVCDDARCETLIKYKTPVRTCSTPKEPDDDQLMCKLEIPDDNYSFAEGIVKEYNLDPEAVIFTRGHWKDALNLFGGLTFDGNNTAEKLLEATPYLIFPTGSLAPMQDSAIFKNLIEQYVSLGGVIIIFAQQYGSEVGKLIPRPGGEKLKVYGWREDSSCLRDSVYYTSMSAPLSSSTSEICSVGVDGYFSVYPSNSTVLLRRRKNREPALLYYKYGDAGGHVFLSSIFTDAAASISQASASERKIVRDLITFAKKPDSIPGFDLEENPTPKISLNIKVTNNTEKTASKAVLKVYTPDRYTLLYQTEEEITLNAGETGVIPINFTLPELSSRDYGIAHCDYELFDSDNELIRMKTESLSGRFYTFKITNPFTPKDGLYQWITVKSERVHWGESYEINMHFKNTTDHTITLDVNDPFFCINHCYPPGIPFDAFNVTVGPGQEYEHLVRFPTTDFAPYATGSFTVRIQYYNSNGKLRQINGAKLLYYEGSVTKSSIELNNTSPLAPGSPLNYSINSSTYSSIPIPGIFNRLGISKFSPNNIRNHRFHR